MPPKINLQHTLDNPIAQQDWPHLQSIAKMVHEYLVKCSKNREYTEAQRAKQKIQQINLHIKKRQAWGITQKYEQNYKRLQAKHIKEKDLLIEEWNNKIGTVDQNLEDSYNKRVKQHKEQTKKLRQQLELALPQNFSPDDKLKQLRHEQKQMAKEGRFIQAQTIKQEIESRQIQLSENHRKLRQTNIKQMMKETQERQERDLTDRKKQWKHVVQEMTKQRNKKIKEMDDKHDKQLKELKWMHQEEVRMSGGM